MAVAYKVIIESGSSASPVGGLLVKFQIVPNKPCGEFVLYPADENPNVDPAFGPPAPYSLFWTPTGQTATTNPTAMVAEGSVNSIPVAAGDEVGIYIRPDGIAEYHLNFNGPGSQPVYISPKLIKQGSLYKVRFQSSNSYNIWSTKAWWIRQGPEWRYSADAQRQDRGLSAGASLVGVNIKARVRQRSIYVGGLPSNWVAGSFVRP